MPKWTPPLTLNQQVALAIIPKITSALSILGSVYITQHIIRSPKRRSLCYHRILLGMSIMDIISSSRSFMSTWILPKESGAWGAVGTVGTCTAAGFFGQGASITSALYNGALALFYLLTVKYSWKDDAFGAYGGSKFSKIESFMHAVPLVFGWATAIAGLPLLLYNPIGWTCWIAEVPRGCDRDPDVPCERGDNSYIYRWAFFHAELWATFVAIMLMMLMMYQSVYDKEKKSRQFSVTQRAKSGGGSTQASRVAMQALLYVIAYCITWCFPMITWLTQLTQGKTYTPILLLQAFFVPLQGWFNFFVYMRPRYLRYRRLKPESSAWRLMVSTLGADLIIEKSATCSSGRRGSDENESGPKRRDTDFHSLNESGRVSTILRRLSLTKPRRKSAQSGTEGGGALLPGKGAENLDENMANEEFEKKDGVECAKDKLSAAGVDEGHGGEEMGDDDDDGSSSLIDEDIFE